MSKEAWDYLRNNYTPDGKGRFKTHDAMEVACHYADEVERLREKCNMQAMVLRHLTPEKYPDVLFIHALLGEKDQNGMPEKLLVVPAYGVDFSYVYERTNRTTGPEW